MTIRFLDLNVQYQLIKHEIDAAIQKVISESAFIGGKYVEQFEENFGVYQNVKYCIGVGNGTDALEIAIEALQFPAGSEIIVPANSFIASSEAVTRSGHRVVFCDCNPDTYTLSLEDVESLITERTKAIIAVHLYGHPCDMDRLIELADRHGLKIIEDCAQAHGAKYRGQMVGGVGTIGTFSFYPGKNLGAYGDGGAIVTNEQELAVRCKKIANHGRIEKYNHEFEGRNSRLDGLQAAILEVKLKYLDGWVDKRRELAAYYLQSLDGIKDITLPKPAAWASPAWHLFVVRCQARDRLKEYLGTYQIQTGVHYPIALSDLPAYSYLPHKAGRLSSQFSGTLLSLPMGEHLSKEDIISVCDCIKSFQV